jgi:hypothetical protein
VYFRYFIFILLFLGSSNPISSFLLGFYFIYASLKVRRRNRYRLIFIGSILDIRGFSNNLLLYCLVVCASIKDWILKLAKEKLMLDQLFANKSDFQKEVEDILIWRP